MTAFLEGGRDRGVPSSAIAHRFDCRRKMLETKLRFPLRHLKKQIAFKRLGKLLVIAFRHLGSQLAIAMKQLSKLLVIAMKQLSLQLG
jgi:hypothetical protein